MYELSVGDILCTVIKFNCKYRTSFKQGFELQEVINKNKSLPFLLFIFKSFHSVRSVHNLKFTFNLLLIMHFYI